MTVEDFIALPEWQRLVAKMRERIEGCQIAGLECSTFDEVRYNAGFRDALLSVIELPTQVLEKRMPEPPSNEPEGTLSLPRHPRATETLY